MTVTINGTNGITLPNGATQSTGAGPAFSAYANAAQTLTSGTATKIAVNTKNFDTNTNFDAATNYRFTPTVAGYYQINAGIAWNSGTNNTVSNAMIYKNGSVWRTTYNLNQSGGSGAFISDLVYLNGSTDYVEFWVTQASGANMTTYVTNGATWMSGCLMRGA